MNICVHIVLGIQVFFSLGKIISSAVAGSYGNGNCKKLPTCFPKGCTILDSKQQYMKVQFFYLDQILVLSFISVIAILVGVFIDFISQNLLNSYILGTIPIPMDSLGFSSNSTNNIQTAYFYFPNMNLPPSFPLSLSLSVIALSCCLELQLTMLSRTGKPDTFTLSQILEKTYDLSTLSLMLPMDFQKMPFNRLS